MATGRREFLRSIGRDGARTAASLIGAVGAIRKEAGEIADEIGEPTSLNQPPRRRAAEAALDLPDDAGLVRRGERHPDPAFASPVRDEEGALVLLDVRALPAQILERRAESAAGVAALLAVDAVAPGPIRALVAALALNLADRSGGAGGRSARRSAAAAALRNAAPLSGSLDDELTALLAIPASDELDATVNARATLRLAAHAAQAERILSEIGSGAKRSTANKGIATGPGLGATSWGDLAPAHEAVRRSGRATLFVATGPSVAGTSRTRLGALDAADAVRARLEPMLLDDVQLASRLARGDASHLLLSSDYVMDDGTAVVPVGGVALALAARAGGARVLLVAPARDRSVVTPRIDVARLLVVSADAAHDAVAGVRTESARFELLAPSLVDAAP